MGPYTFAAMMPTNKAIVKKAGTSACCAVLCHAVMHHAVPRFAGMGPYTLAAMMPTNKAIIKKAEEGADAGPELLSQWGSLHLVRSIASVAGRGAGDGGGAACTSCTHSPQQVGWEWE